MAYDPLAYYELGKAIYRAVERGEPLLQLVATLASRDGRNETYYLQAYSYYRLFCRALGLPWTVFRLGPRRLKALRRQIDWDARGGAVRNGRLGKWSRAVARRRILQLLEASGVDDGAR